MPTSTETDCRSPQGITVGLLDAMLSIARILAPRLNSPGFDKAVAEALRDYWEDSDIRDIHIAAIHSFRSPQTTAKCRLCDGHGWIADKYIDNK